jgi:cysteine desulfurase
MKRYYFDYAATTPVDPRVAAYLQELYANHFGNSAGVHAFARDMREILDAARQNVAGFLGALPDEIIFTASATESNNFIIKGLAQRHPQKKHLIISDIEHASVLRTAQFLEKAGYELSFLPVDASGKIQIDQLRRLIRPDTLLVSVIWVNNELGTVQDVQKIGAICREANVLFHTDAVQGFAKLPLNVREAHIDLLTASSHKIYGPIGAGLAFVRNGVSLEPLLHGGGHEFGKRASTVNVPAIAAFVKAAELYEQERQSEHERIRALRQRIITALQESIPQMRLNSPDDGLPHILNISFKNVNNEILAMYLDRQGIAVATGSACSSGKVRESRILKALNVSREWSSGTLRISLGRFTSEEETDYLINELPKAVEKVRKMS